MFKPHKQWIAKEDIKKGNIVRILWKNYMRPARSDDTKIAGFSIANVKKGKRGAVVVSLNNIYEVDVT